MFAPGTPSHTAWEGPPTQLSHTAWVRSDTARTGVRVSASTAASRASKEDSLEQRHGLEEAVESLGGVHVSCKDAPRKTLPGAQRKGTTYPQEETNQFCFFF